MKKSISHIAQSDFSHSGLEEVSMNPDPVKQFSLWFDAAVKFAIEQPEAMFLATASKSGVPSGRMVLMKGFDANGFIFFTNYNSRKGMAIAENPVAAITFYWKELNRQVRITGNVQRVSAAESDRYFDSRPLESRIGALVSKQSSVISGRAYLDDIYNEIRKTITGKELKRPKHWGGFRIKPAVYEFWQEGPHRLHDRIQYRRIKGKWILERLAP
ncbi:MAG: pyridoxamine 5'-phosphate oxidase [Bacteroidetes bacterium]|nr:pyridoxamine 5'-phosphate oxidase [Bacteroidota bacterium]